MSKIMRLSDRFKLKIDDIEFTLAPLSNLQKSEIVGCTYMQGGEEKIDLMKYQSLFIKYGLKDVKGLTDLNGEDYELEFEGDNLSDNCVSELFTIEQRPVLTKACATIMNGQVPKIKGVKVEVSSGKCKA